MSRDSNPKQLSSFWQSFLSFFIATRLRSNFFLKKALSHTTVVFIITFVYTFLPVSSSLYIFKISLLHLLILLFTFIISPLAGLTATLTSSLLLTFSQDVTLTLVPGLTTFLFGSCVILLHRALHRHYHRLSQKTNQLKALINQSPHPFVLKNKSGLIVYASLSIKNIIGVHQQTIIGKDLKHFLHEEDKDKYKNFYAQLLSNPSKRHTVELRVRNKRGSWSWFKIDAINLLHDPIINSTVSLLQNISHQKYQEDMKARILTIEKKARETAEKAVRTRDEFLSIASHELKTPLTTILLQLQGTLRRILTQSLADFSGQKLVSSLKIAEQQSQRLSLMIKDLLNVSLITTGRITLKKQPTELKPLIEDLAERFSEELDQKKTQIRLRLTSGTQGLWDPIRIEQALSNLITNAIKFGQGKPIVITTQKVNSQAIITVQDKGIGIYPQDKVRIFKLFQQGNKDQYKGLGVGLFIAQKIVESHDGKLTVVSLPKKGSTFTITLPLE